jgi:hypothetical protein
MQHGIWEHPEWYRGLTVEARFEEFQAELHRQNVSGCPSPCTRPNPSRRVAGVPGGILDLPVKDERWSQLRELTFYAYRAEADTDYPLENVDCADLAGVMWYLHNEIVPSYAVTRKYNITRIVRFKISMKTSWEFYNAHRRQFGGFVAFDSGHCTVPDCDQIWQHFGFIVGCQHQDTSTTGYRSSVKTRLGHCKSPDDPDCRVGVWYSLPGPCPGERFDRKTDTCKALMPGGRCDKPTGSKTCTYSVEVAGEIRLDELAGIPNYHAFFDAGLREYVGHLDHGIGCNFWDGKTDTRLCSIRMDRVKKMFKEKYPHLPGCDELPEPPCDFIQYYKDEFTWQTHSEPLDPSWEDPMLRTLGEA